MIKEYVTGGQMHRCPECGTNWYEEAEVRSYDHETGKDELISVTPASEHPANGCPRAKAMAS